ncbi:MAG: tetratricopeptide repeat protein, partial [Flavobacteriaceae bacterium]
LVSHADITPSLTGLFHNKYQMKMPAEVSFIGSGLVEHTPINSRKQIPLYRHAYNIKDFISGSYFSSSGNIQKITNDLRLVDPEENAPLSEVESDFKRFKAVNKYVVRQNKLIPQQNTLFAQVAREPSKQEMIWINSVFNGADFDNAYKTARDLALEGDRDRALLLCSYILNRVPGHADTEILMGRIHAWQGQYEIATEILEGAILKYPVYDDAYAALLDVYFWSDKNERALLLQRQMERNKVENDELKLKLDRAVRSVIKSSRQSSKLEEKQRMDEENTMVISTLE